MITYFRMKYNEWKLKYKFYRMVNELIDNQEEIVELVKRLFIVLKDTSTEDLYNELFNSLAKIVHEENKINNYEENI